MDFTDEELHNYCWESQMLIQSQELDSWINEAVSGCSATSSLEDDVLFQTAPKNVASERNRRKTLNEKLFSLRALVPNISKMDKASIVKDAIEYIQELREQERKIQAEILELESTISSKKPPCFDSELDQPTAHFRSKRKRTELCHGNPGRLKLSPIEVLELRVMEIGERTVMVRLTCSKREDTMVRLCQMFESLQLQIVATNMTAFSDRLLKIAFVQNDDDEQGKEHIRSKVEAAIAALNDSSKCCT